MGFEDFMEYFDAQQSPDVVPVTVATKTGLAIVHYRTAAWLRIVRDAIPCKSIYSVRIVPNCPVLTCKYIAADFVEEM